jgi:peptidyl-prolyl cis-trans isomerase C
MRASGLLSLGLALLALPAIAAAQVPDPTRPELRPEPTAVPSSPEETARRAQVVARVGDVSITLGQVEDEVNHQSPFMRIRFQSGTALREHVEEMIRVELLAREAERRGFADDPEVTDAVRQSSVQLLIRHDFDDRITAASIPADDVREYYEQHPAEFHQPEMRRASQIVLATRLEADALVAETSHADARTFRQLVTQHSADTETRIRGGDLRYFDADGHTPNAADPDVPIEAARAAFALTNVGDVSGVIAEGERFAIVELTGLRAAEDRTLSQADTAIRSRLWRTTRQAALETFVDGLRERIPTEVFYDRSRGIHMEPPERSSADPLPADPDEIDPADPSAPALSPDQVLGGPAAPAPAPQ